VLYSSISFLSSLAVSPAPRAFAHMELEGCL